MASETATMVSEMSGYFGPGNDSRPELNDRSEFMFGKRLQYSLMLLFLLRGVDAFAVDKSLEGIACRSVHLAWAEVPDATAFYNEAHVQQSADGTYFAVCGFSRGYYGIQELYDGRKVIIFSVWDPGKQNNPNEVDEAQRVKLLYNHPDVTVRRFGNEGTGGQSFLNFDWKVGQTYRFAVAARRNTNRTEYASFFFHPDKKEWLHLVTFSTLTPDTLLKGYYSFVEDFRRNRESAQKTRTALFSNPAVRQIDGQWSPVRKARFTADSNPAVNINAGLRDGQCYLSTGGEISNTDTPLNYFITRTNVETVVPEGAEQVIRAWLESPLK
ncbi:MAG: DUF3472 domain-containing protein [Planctomycetaceae bacterium]|nr:DUF3472 domain-containing protein [Planctomycetaceae bacterium]